jgi:hypothetical protein
VEFYFWSAEKILFSVQKLYAKILDEGQGRRTLLTKVEFQTTEEK